MCDHELVKDCFQLAIMTFTPLFQMKVMWSQKMAILYLQKSHNTPPSPPKICIGIVLDFSWDIFMLQEKLQTMIMQNVEG